VVQQTMPRRMVVNKAMGGVGSVAQRLGWVVDDDGWWWRRERSVGMVSHLVRKLSHGGARRDDAFG
jgi:hypothetical protein